MTTLLPQSRKLSSRSGVDSKWLRSLFDFLDRRPKSAVYSMAFVLTCARTYDLSEANAAMRPDLVAGFEAARELLHLLDGNINDDDDDRRHRRDEERCCLDVVSFARANDKYIESFDGTFLPVARYCQRVAAAKDATTTTTTTNDDGDDDDGEKGTAAARATLELYRVLSRANEYANATKLRIPANSRCSVSVERIDLSPLIEQQRRPRNNSDGDTATLGRLLNRRVVPSDQTSYTYLEAYIAYSPMVHRFDSLSALIARWNERHSTIDKDEPDDDDDESLRCVLLPSRSVWQSGTSQILWIVMHTLAALTVQRRNRYVHRALAVLEHLSFYVWCADCSMHWRSNRGDDYFRHVSTLTRLNRLPIDILLLRCHNAVNGNSSSSLLVTPPPTSPVAVAAIDDRDGFASKWTLANLCLDYRDFAAIGLLKRGDRESSRAHRANLCRPMVRAIERINGSSGHRAAEDADSPEYLLSMAIVDSGATAPPPPLSPPRDPTTAMQHLLFGALKQQYGEALLRKLWHDIDPSLTVPVCAMY